MHGWTDANNDKWRAFALFNGTVGTFVMIAAVILTLYSLVVYMRSFGRVFATAPGK